MDTKKLRQKILDLAIRGKLVPQDPNDEPASILLERIRAEKERLIAEGKIKRPKSSTKGRSRSENAKTSSSESHYQKFDIPDSWVWIKLEDILTVKSGESLNVRELQSENEYPIYGGNGVNGFYDKHNVEKDTLIIGRVGFYCGCIHKTNSKAWVTDNALIVNTYISSIYLGWLEFALIWSDLRSTSNSTAQPVVSGKSIYPVAIPLPPYQEQIKIASQLKLFNHYIELIEAKVQFLSNTISDVKAKILELAMQGKLVPQDPADEPAADMLRRVNPKARIITDNPHYPQLPDNWVLTTVKDAFTINPKNLAENDRETGFVPMANIEDGFSNSFRYEIRKWAEIKTGFTHFADGDIAVAKISPCLENRKSMVLQNLPNGIGAGTTELLIFRSDIIIPEFGLLFFKSDIFVKKCVGTFNGVVGQQRVGKNIVEEIAIPIPPQNQQKEIIKRVKSLFSLLDIISDNLTR